MRQLLFLTLCFFTLGSSSINAQNSSYRSNSIVNIAGSSYYVHTVAKGDDLKSLAKMYGVSQDMIIINNPAAADQLNEGMAIKIPANLENPVDKLSRWRRGRLFKEHIVRTGETAYSIAKKYGISIDILVEDNHLMDITSLSIGQSLNIRRKSIGDSHINDIQQQLQTYTDDLNSINDSVKYHLVSKGDTFYNLSKKYNINIDKLKEINSDYAYSGLTLGTMIKIPRERVQEEIIVDEVAENRHINVSFNKERVTDGSIDITMFLPLSSSDNFVGFYQGALLALNRLKAKGVRASLSLFDTQRSTDKIQQIINTNDLSNTDVFIGPIYESTASVVISLAERLQVPMVSPLANFQQIQSRSLFQLAPGDREKYTKLKPIFSGDKNVIVVSAGANDEEFSSEVAPLVPTNAKRLNYTKDMSSELIEQLLSADRENVILVIAKNEYSVEEVLARLSSIQNNLKARSIKLGKISVVGSSKWSRFNNLDRNLFFKLNLSFVSSYFAERSDDFILKVNEEYISAFGELPTLYSYRGYDAVILFVEALRDNSVSLLSGLNDRSFMDRSLIMPYWFDNHGKSHINSEWGLVRYSSDYSIKVE